LGGRRVTSVVDRLRRSDQPSVRWKIRTQVLDEDPESAGVKRLRGEIRRSPLVRYILDQCAAAHRPTYTKWMGPHWVLITLADLGYPAGAPELEPLAAGVMKTWLGRPYYAEHSSTDGKQRRGVPIMDGLYRRCGSQQGGGLLAAVRLGLRPDDQDRLVERLQHWQWPDGGWNCSRRPEARSSSVYETLLPMRGLAAYAHARSGERPDLAAAAGTTAAEAAEVLLTRRVLFHRSTGTLIRSEWVKLHYPVYWYYDVLAATKGLMEAGRLDDERCQDALDLLERKELPDGGWAAEGAFYRAPGARGQAEIVDWGGVDAGRMNEWVTADALAVLHAAGRRT
jgi:hypothetical protein